MLKAVMRHFLKFILFKQVAQTEVDVNKYFVYLKIFKLLVLLLKNRKDLLVNKKRC